MIVEELNDEECRQVLAQARLACAAENQPYIVPMFLADHRRPSGEDRLYGFTTLGQKVEWMRANPNVCVEVDEIVNRSEWQSVVALGRYEELPNVHEVSQGRPPIRQSPLGRPKMHVVSQRCNEHWPRLTVPLSSGCKGSSGIGMAIVTPDQSACNEY